MTALALNSDTLRTIKLSGALGRKFGRVHRLAVDSPAEAVRALCVLFKGFRSEIEKPGARFHVLVGKQAIGEDGLQLHGGDSYTFAPATAGSKRAGLLQTILGAVLIVAAFAFAGSPIAPFLFKAGVAMVIGGVIQMLAPMPKAQTNDKPENTPNTQFNGAVNTQAQGHPVPIAYGELIVGSAVISAGVSTGFTTVGGSTNSDGSNFSPGGGSGLLK